jgi:hypothetical protein
MANFVFSKSLIDSSMVRRHCQHYKFENAKALDLC